MTTETDEKTKTTTTEEWLYAGRRLDGKDKPYDLWVDPSGTEKIFGKLAGVQPGNAYAVEVIRDGDRLSVRGTPRYLGTDQATRRPTEHQLLAWKAEHEAARQTLESKRLEKAAAEDDQLEQALEVLRRHKAKLRSYAKKGAFTTYVIGELDRPPTPDREEV